MSRQIYDAMTQASFKEIQFMANELVSRGFFVETPFQVGTVAGRNYVLNRPGELRVGNVIQDLAAVIDQLEREKVELKRKLYER